MALVASSSAIAATADAQTRSFHLPAGEAAITIPEFGRQAGVRISAPVSGLRGKRTPAIMGVQNVRAALTRLISGLGLEVASDDGANIVLRRASATQAAASQNQAPDPADAEILVTGTRASVKRGIEIKRERAGIIDTVSASEIGQLPDFNAGDALKRIPGVNTLLYQGEPRFIITRGFNQTYNDIQIDGFSLASTDSNQGNSGGGRQISMEVLPSNLASHIDVIKSATPETNGNFIGGLVNFSTNSAFDFGSDMLSASVKGGQALDKKENGGNHFAGQATASAAKRFGANDEFGLYLTSTYWQRYINVPQLEGGGRNWYTDGGVRTTTYGGNGYGVPQQRLFYNYKNKRKRFSVQGRLDWKPNPGFSAYVSAYHFYQNENSFRNDLNAGVQNSSMVLNQTPTSGTLTNVTQNLQYVDQRWFRYVTGTYGRFDSDLGGGLRLDGGFSWSTSRVRSPEIIDYFDQKNLQFNYDDSGKIPIFTPLNPTQANDLSRYGSSWHRDRLQRLKENRYDAQIRLGYNSRSEDRGFGGVIGGSLLVNRQDQRFDRTQWNNLPYTAADAWSGQVACGFGCNTPVPLLSPEKLAQLFQANKGTVAEVLDLAANAGNTYKTREDVGAAYVQVQYRSDDLYIVGGVRVEKTWTGSSSTRAVNGVYQPISASRDYTNVLPSALLVWNVRPDQKLRAGLSMTVSRPNFSSSSLKGGALDTTLSPPTLSTGNPELKPRRAVNADIGYDWYFSQGHGIVSVAGFYKWIQDDVFNYATLQTVPGISVPVLVTQPRNTDQTVRGYGVEFSASHDLTFLPEPFDGLGASVNFTLSRAHFPVTLSDGSTRVLSYLPQQARRIANASLYYDKGKAHGRIAWNYLGSLWDDRYPNFDPSGFYSNRIQQPTNNVDLQLSYDITPNVTASFDALNITKQGFRYMIGDKAEYFQSQWALPTQLLLGVKVKM
ncbi:TonB-dependent receptor [Sphingobium ummariense]